MVPGRAALLLQQQLGVAGDPGARSRSAARSPRRGRWCAATGCGPGSRPSPRCRCAATLLKTSCAVSDQPLVWLCVRRLRRLGVLRVELAHQPRPQRAGGAHLGDLHEEVHADRPEEAEPRRELVDVEAGGEAGAEVLDAVGQRVGELEVGGRPGLLHVVAGDRDRVEARHLLGGVAEDVADDPHARLRRVDVGVADHELLEDVVLDGPRELLRLHPLLLGRGDVERHAPAAPRRSWSCDTDISSSGMPSKSVRAS